MEVEIDEGEDINGTPVPIDEVTPVETPAETPVEPAEPAKEPVKFDEEQQKVFDKVVSDKVTKTHEERRRADALQLEVDALKAKIPVEARPVVPDMPDQYAEDYQQQLAVRDKAIADQSAYDHGERQRTDAELREQQRAQQEQERKLGEALTDYSGRATKLGIKQEELDVAGKTLMNYQMDDQVAAYILDEPIGPQITVYLSKNPAVMDRLSQMSPMAVVAEIASTIKPLAAKMSKQVDLPPDPTETLSGSGVVAGNGPQGVKVTYE